MAKKIIGLFVAVAAVLLLAVVSAGCIGDQIEGTYMHAYNDGDEFIKFNGDGTYVRATFDYRGNLKNKYQGKWQKVEDNLYTIGDEEAISGFGLVPITSSEKVEYFDSYITRYRGGMPKNYNRCD